MEDPGSQTGADTLAQPGMDVEADAVAAGPGAGTVADRPGSISAQDSGARGAAGAVGTSIGT